ncbi:MAG: hypothetical protein R3344_06495 [Acidobacteriota bacterium]|nr:hypothetical protein [Acidobacteriota bacterium]
MIRAANHSFYPRVGENPLDQQLRTVLRKRSRGKASDADVAAVADEVAGIAVAEQSRAFIDVVTDGLIRWDGLLSHVAAHLEGVEVGGLERWFDTNFYDRRPEIVGPIGRPEAFLVRDYECAMATALTPVKMVLPGPVTFARLSKDRHYGDVAAAARAVAEALALEVRDLSAAGAKIFQLDEPLLCAHPDDAELVAETGGQVFAGAGENAVTILSTYFGDLAGVADLDVLPGTHLGLDMVGGPANFDLLARLPEGKNVALGLFDARTTRLEDAADVAELLAPHREHLVVRDVMVGPQTGLEYLPRDQAFDKLQQARYLVEKLSKEWTWVS